MSTGIAALARDRKRLAANDPPQMTLEDEHDERKRVMVDHLRALAGDLLHERKGDGITADELRRRAEIRGWIREDEPGRTLSFLSSMLRGLGAVPCHTRQSEHRNANHRLLRVWIHRDYLEPHALASSLSVSPAEWLTADERAAIAHVVKVAVFEARECGAEAWAALQRVGLDR